MIPLLFHSTCLALSLITFSITICSIFMHENEHGEWQSRIEALWISTDDRRLKHDKQSPSHIAAISDFTLDTLQRLLGRTPVSVQLIGVSTAMSIGGAFLVPPAQLLSLYVTSGFNGTTLTPQLIHALVTIFLTAMLFCLVGLTPAIFRNAFGIFVSAIPLALITLGVSTLIIEHRMNASDLSILLYLVLSVALDVALLAVVRLTLRDLSVSPSRSKLLLALCNQFGIIILILFSPNIIFWAGKTIGISLPRYGTVQMLPLLNIFTIVASLLFSMTFLLLFLSRSIWPAMGRLLYPVQRFELVKKPKRMFGISLLLLFLAFPHTSMTFADILKLAHELLLV